MNKKGFNNSDLARAVWGETTDSKGYIVARNRDRIGVYLKGQGFPEASTLAKIAKVLDTTAEELAPHTAAAEVDGNEFSTNLVGDCMHVQMNMMLPLPIANEIARLVTEARTKERVEANAVVSSDGKARDNAS